MVDDESKLETRNKIYEFIKKTKSDINFNADLAVDSLDFEWLDRIEYSCTFIDNIVRKPKLTLVREENTVKIEKSKKVTLDSIKDLSKHTNYISRVDKKTEDVEPSKILDVRNEETYNIYENRFLYTLINDMDKFISEKEKILKEFKLNEKRNLEYLSKSTLPNSKVEMEFRITSETVLDENISKKIKKDLESSKIRIKRVKEYINSWRKSEMYKSLEKIHVAFINPPIKKTNIFLKNPNFIVASNLWNYLLKLQKQDSNIKEEILKNNKAIMLKGILDHSFLLDYFVLSSISNSKKTQKDKVKDFSLYLITEEIDRILNLLKELNINVSEEELHQFIKDVNFSKKSESKEGKEKIKKKFKDAIDEYLDIVEDYAG